MSSGLIKFIIKVLDENADKLVWEHICYAPKDLYLRYLSKKGLERFEMADCIRAWANEDFNFDLAMTTSKDIPVLKQLVIDKYMSVYPHITRSTPTDHQGWMRVWVSTHMEKDLMRK